MSFFEADSYVQNVNPGFLWQEKQCYSSSRAQIVVNELIFKLLCGYRRENQA